MVVIEFFNFYKVLYESVYIYIDWWIKNIFLFYCGLIYKCLEVEIRLI